MNDSMSDTMTGSRGRMGADDANYADGQDVTLDKNVPEISDAFAGCKVGDTYVVKSDDDQAIVLTKQSSGDDSDADAAGGDDQMEPDENAGSDNLPHSDNPSIAVLIARKKKS